MVTAKGLIKEMKEAGFLTIEELKDILNLECDTREIDVIIKRLKRDKDYLKFLNGEYKMCSKCKNLYIYDCFYKIHDNGLKGDCKNCSQKDYKERYYDRIKDYRKTAYLNRKERGLIDRELVNASTRRSRLKKYLKKKLGSKCSEKTLEELIFIKYDLLDTTIKNDVLFELCFENGKFIGQKRIKEILKNEKTK